MVHGGTSKEPLAGILHLLHPCSTYKRQLPADYHQSSLQEPLIQWRTNSSIVGAESGTYLLIIFRLVLYNFLINKVLASLLVVWLRYPLLFTLTCPFWAQLRVISGLPSFPPVYNAGALFGPIPTVIIRSVFTPRIPFYIPGIPPKILHGFPTLKFGYLLFE